MASTIPSYRCPSRRYTSSRTAGSRCTSRASDRSGRYHSSASRTPRCRRVRDPSSGSVHRCTRAAQLHIASRTFQASNRPTRSARRTGCFCTTTHRDSRRGRRRTYRSCCRTCRSSPCPARGPRKSRRSSSAASRPLGKRRTFHRSSVRLPRTCIDGSCSYRRRRTPWRTSSPSCTCARSDRSTHPPCIPCPRGTPTCTCWSRDRNSCRRSMGTRRPSSHCRRLSPRALHPRWLAAASPPPPMQPDRSRSGSCRFRRDQTRPRYKRRLRRRQR